jgi:hypothetical protein
MTPEERAIDLEAANQRLAEMNLKREPLTIDGYKTPVRTDTGLQWIASQPPVFVDASAEYAAQQAGDPDAENGRQVTQPLEFRDMSAEYATQQGQKPPRKRRSDAGQPKPRPAPAAVPQGPAGALSDKQWERLNVLIETQLKTAISRRDAAQSDDFAKAALADYLDELRNPRGPQDAMKAGA